jgi:uncharacterized membrane protein
VRVRRPLAIAAAALAAAVTMLVLDLTWLGFLARRLYDSALGSLKRPEVYGPAAVLFYAFYLAAIVRLAILGPGAPVRAAGRGAVLGLVAYGTYELTNWAVIRDWPAILVPVDLAWGVALTATASFAGALVLSRLQSDRR